MAGYLILLLGNLIDTSLAQIGTAVSLGIFFLIGFALSVELVIPKALSRLVHTDGTGRRIQLAFFVAIAFVAGLSIENISNLVVDEFSVALSPVPNEKTIRSRVLLRPEHARRYWQTQAMRDYLNNAQVDSSQLALLESYASKATEAEVPRDTSVNDIYYTAKNMVFREDNYFAELQKTQSRIDFARSFTFACLVLFVVAVICLAFGVWVRRKSCTALLVVCGTFFFLYWIGRFSYTAEEIEFNKRVFGYFLSLVQSPSAQ